MFPASLNKDLQRRIIPRRLLYLIQCDQTIQLRKVIAAQMVGKICGRQIEKFRKRISWYNEKSRFR